MSFGQSQCYKSKVWCSSNAYSYCVFVLRICVVNHLLIGVALLKDRVECLVFHLHLGTRSLDAVVPHVLVEFASSIFELGLWMQTLHSFVIVVE